MKITLKGAEALKFLESLAAGGEVKEAAIALHHAQNLRGELESLEVQVELDKKLSPVIAWALAITAAIVLSLSWYLG